MENKLVVLESFYTEIEASIAKGSLEANGITAYIFNNDPSGPAGQPSVMTGTHLDFAIRLMVGSSDLNEAGELLKRKEES